MADTSISEVRICNMALSLIGTKSSIEALDEGSSESNECDLWYNYSRKQALAANDWSFARKRLTLATHSDDPPATWAYRYQYPSDCIVMRKIQNPAAEGADVIPFEVELDDSQTAMSILTDLDEAIGVYTFDLTNVVLFSEFFVAMHSTALAARVVYALTGKDKLEETMNGRFIAMSGAARASDANESVARAPRDADYIRGR